MMLDAHKYSGAVPSSPTHGRRRRSIRSTYVGGPMWWQTFVGMAMKRRAEVATAAAIVAGYVCIVAGVAVILPWLPVVLIGAGLGLLGIAGYRLVLAVVLNGVYVLSERSKAPPPTERSERRVRTP